ncbi:porphobilinogen deaminase, dipyromethane cofactor binding domain-containing protein [Cladochytrium replicatum]|nr:porphobilinogen deaminase, dipyromethane cofactor binding domain-containing protein [Cladochytrium replicatum]
MAPSRSKIVIGSRESQLAMVQSKHVLSLLRSHNPDIEFEILGMTTQGDKVLDVALNKVGKSVFTKELEVALNEKSVDLVVHSLKDMPTLLPDGLVIGAITQREDPRDAVVFNAKWKGKKGLEELPLGSVVGTSSVRRVAQLSRRFPHLKFLDVRGNLQTRFKKLDADDSPYDALLLAYAGLHRMGLDSRISSVLSPETMLHAVGQGALGIECRANDGEILSLVQQLDDHDTHLRCAAERAFMRKLEGGCSVPLGVGTSFKEDKDGVRILELKVSVCSRDGSREILTTLEKRLDRSTYEDNCRKAEELGQEIGGECLLLGAKEILAEIRST